MKILASKGASVDKTENGYLLKIPKGDSSSYRIAQLDNYHGLPRRRFPVHYSTLSLRARTSAFPIPGTWGFGFWNDPFGMSLGFGGNPFRLPALPNATWFFGASQENHLSFTDKPANGFLAQTFRSPRFHPLLALMGLVFPFSRVKAREILGMVIQEDGCNLWNQGARSRPSTSKLVDSIDPTQWHSYRLEWNPNRVVWYVDDVQVFESAVSPNPPLGLVIWIDNQFASFTPEGKIRFGVLENPEPAWLEIKDLKVD